MADEKTQNEVAKPVIEGPWTAGRRRAWLSGLALSLMMLLVIGLLLARLIWLPFYFGLFFFLIAGLLAGACSFRVARAARPVATGRIIRGVGIVAILTTCAFVVYEYRSVASTAAGERKFPEARNAAVRAGRSLEEVKSAVTARFNETLDTAYPPGGTLGYIRWAIAGGEMNIEVEGSTDRVAITQTGVAWPIRTLIAAVLLAAGLWSSYESLRSASPVTNILAPGEEYDEED